MKITKLTISDFLGIGTFSYDRFGKFNRLKGKNGVGKSSVLKAIQEAFKERGHDPELIKIDSECAEIMIELDGQLEISRKITPERNQIDIVHAGQPITKPAAFLKKLIGNGHLVFDPVLFYLADKRTRRDLLLQAVHFVLDRNYIETEIEHKGFGDLLAELDLSEIDWHGHGLLVFEQVKGVVYDRRGEANHEVDITKKAIEKDRSEIPEIVDSDKWQKFDLSKMTKELAEKQNVVSAKSAKEKMLDRLRSDRDRIKQTIQGRDNEIKQLQERLEMLIATQAASKAELEQTIAAGKDLKEEIENMQPPATDEIETEIAAYEQHQKALHRLEDIERREKQLEALEATADRLNQFFKLLDTGIKKEILSNVEFPVEGLTVKEDIIRIDDIELDKRSSGEQLVFSIRLAKQLAGDVKILCVDGFEKLDDDAKSALVNEAEKDEFEYFLTEVSNDRELKIDSAGETAPVVQLAMTPDEDF